MISLNELVDSLLRYIHLYKVTCRPANVSLLVNCMAFDLLNGIIYFVSGAFKKNLYAAVFATSVAIFI